jgi:hypothetical protein
MNKSRTTPAPTTGASFVEAMDFVANGRSADTLLASEDEATSEPAAAPAPIEPRPVAARPIAPTSQPGTENQQTTGKKEATEPFDYASAFLTPVRTRKNKSIYVDDALHKALSVLTQVAGVGLADLLINIANDHFERYRPAIQKYMSDQEKLRRKELPY